MKIRELKENEPLKVIEVIKHLIIPASPGKIDEEEKVIEDERIKTIIITDGEIEKQTEENGRLHIRYERDEAQCIYCGNCVENCPQKALKFTKEYEFAVDIKSELRKIV